MITYDVLWIPIKVPVRCRKAHRALNVFVGLHGTGEPGSAAVGLESPQAVWGVPLNDVGVDVVENSSHMVGSYGPKKELQSFTTQKDTAPSGMLARGSYTVKSLFTDDDKHEHLKWEWKIDIKKDW